jgi:hypothetical protein
MGRRESDAQIQARLVREREEHQQRRRADVNRVVLALRYETRGAWARGVAQVLGIEADVDRLLPSCLDEAKAKLQACEDARTHWKPRELRPVVPPNYPRCRACGLRIDIPVEEDPERIAEALREAVAEFRAYYKPGPVPTASQLLEAGFYTADAQLPGRIQSPVWRAIIGGVRHDLTALESALRLAKAEGTVPGREGRPDDPEKLACGRTEQGRRWSF